MNVRVAIDLIAYGLVLLGLTFAALKLGTENRELLLFIGIGGAALTWFWSALSFRGVRCRRRVIWTLSVISTASVGLFLDALMTVNKGEADSRLEVLVLALMAIFSVGQLSLHWRERKPTDE